MKLHDLFEEENEYFELEWDDEPTINRRLPMDQQHMLDRHDKKKTRSLFRKSERQRREKEERIYAPEDDYYGVNRSRHVPKSIVGYKPFKWPMIRFGKFRERSRVGFDAEMRADIGNITHESGVSCFHAMAHDGGYLIMEHDGASSWSGTYNPIRMLMPWVRRFRPQYDRWKKDGTPMDIFILRGYLVAHGYDREWLTTGQDGEYLMDIRKPHRVEHVTPDRVWISDRMTLQEYYERNPMGHTDHMIESDERRKKLSPFVGMTRDDFLGNPKITSVENANQGSW